MKIDIFMKCKRASKEAEEEIEQIEIVSRVEFAQAQIRVETSQKVSTPTD